MSIVENRISKIDFKTQLINNINLLSEEQQKQMLWQVKNMLLMNQANILDGSVEPNNMTMEEIVAEQYAAKVEIAEARRKNAQK